MISKESKIEARTGARTGDRTGVNTEVKADAGSGGKKAGKIPSRVNPIAVFLITLAGLILLSLYSLGNGRYLIAPGELLSLILESFFGYGEGDLGDSRAGVVLFYLRLPRILLSILAGGALAASGAAYQSLFKNPMVAPDILGVTSGAGAGASLALLWGLSGVSLQVMAFSGGLLAVLIVMGTSRTLGPDSSMVTLILTGVVVSSLFAALGSFIKYMAASTDNLSGLVLWLMGSFAHAGAWPGIRLLFIFSVIGLIPLFLAGWSLNAMSFGEEEAASLGVDVGRLKLTVIFSSTLLTASVAALCGLVGWVGLIVPHLARFLTGPNFATLLPVSYVLGAFFTLAADSLVRLVLPGEMPVGIVTSVIGAPLFIHILKRSRQSFR
jgi:iron complex transport system permease protein